jgi:Glycerate kinase family
MRVVVAPDKFKGSLTAVEAAEAIGEGLRQGRPGLTSFWLRLPTAVTAPSTPPWRPATTESPPLSPARRGTR